MSVAPLDVALATALVGVVAWIGLSALWSASVPLTLLELERGLVYLTAVVAVLVALERRDVEPLVAGVVAGAVLTAVVNLGARLSYAGTFVDLGERGRLAAPIGYENALGLLCALGIVAAVGLGGAEGGVRRRAAAGASVVPLATVLATTGNRGGWVALAVGLALAVGAGGGRTLAFAASVAPAAVAAAALAAVAHVLDPEAARTATRSGAVLVALLVVGLALVGAAAAGRLRPPPLRPRVWAGAAVAVVLAVAAAAAAGPQRHAYWRVALEATRDEPALGTGAGTFARTWLERRNVPLDTRDAHSLYLEALSELGPLGLALVVLALALPLVAVRRAPPAAVGAYAAYLAHAAFDWDWEMPAVTLAALVCGASILLSARDRVRELGRRFRLAAAAVALAVAALALAGFAGHVRVDQSERAALRFDWAASAAAARSAQRLAPWSAEPWLRLAVAEQGRGESDAARRALRRGLERDPGDVRLWRLLAEVGESGEREAALERARDLDPLGAAKPS